MYYCNKCGYNGPNGPRHPNCNYFAWNSKGGADLTVQEIANIVAQFLPIGYTLSVRIEHGSAWAEVADACGAHIPLPDFADKSLCQQINDGLCCAVRMACMKTPNVVTLAVAKGQDDGQSS